MTSRARLTAFAVVAVLCVAVAAGYFLREVQRSQAETESQVPIVSDPAELRTVSGEPHVLFRNTASGNGYGLVSIAPLRDPAGPRYSTPLACDRVDFAGGTGVCLAADRGVFTTYNAEVFDSAFKPIHTLPLTGVPSRVRVAPNGALAAVTVFVNGHSYASDGFSTQTTIIDTRRGAFVGELEKFAVLQDGKPFKAVDFNFWGVTFAPDSNAFFATLNSGGIFYLIRGDAASRVANVVGQGVECPSLSPDSKRIAFKKRVIDHGRLIWHIAVRALESGAERVLAAEGRSVDDQVEWLDNGRILYGISDDELGGGRTSVWMIDLDGNPPVRWVPDAFSPSVWTGFTAEQPRP
jgi:dipeptidyl aminopeptidase/acylaminoacyl peptidase